MMPRALAIVVLLVAALARVAAAQCPSEGDCREVHETPGCELPECCAIVCKQNPLCCEQTWDALCVEIALNECEGINCPNDGSCDEPKQTPGCADFGCCDFISTFDGWCESASWDEICVVEKGLLCGVEPCTISVAGVTLDENEPCYERLNDGCAVGFESGRIALPDGARMRGRISGGGPRDTDWFALDGATRRRFRLEIESEFPAELQLLEGDCEGVTETPWLVGMPLCEGPQSLVFLVGAGTTNLILGAGSDARAIRAGIDCDEIDPDNPPAPDDPPPLQIYGLKWTLSLAPRDRGDIDGDGDVNAVDLAALLGAWGDRDEGEPFDPRLPDADLDGDGRVGAADLAILLGDWAS
jgi:hypothetical protein